MGVDIKIGLIARADNRGLGTLTQEFYRHMAPERTLMVLTGDPAFPDYPERFKVPGTLPGTLYEARLGPKMTLDEHTVRMFLAGLDVVYTAETFYDWKIVNWAREMGVKTVVHGMPELTRHHRERLPMPDEWWWPTEWMTDSRIPKGKIVEIPVVVKSLCAANPFDAGPLRVLHPGGKQALADRDGTLLFIEAMGYVTEDVHVTLVAQDRDFDQLPDRPNVEWEVIRGVEDRWDMYRDQHVAVLPRRYGGLSLKVHEALGCGVPVVMPNISPNNRWPGQRVPALPGKRIRVPFGPLPTWDADPHAIADEIDEMARDRSLVAVDQTQAYAWASKHSWHQLKPIYEAAFKAMA